MLDETRRLEVCGETGRVQAVESEGTLHFHVTQASLSVPCTWGSGLYMGNMSDSLAHSCVGREHAALGKWTYPRPTPSASPSPLTPASLHLFPSCPSTQG
jgi:hypothetical protein